MAKYTTMFTSTDLANAGTQTLNFPLGTVKGCSIRIDNQSPYGLEVYEGTDLSDYIQPNSFVIMPLPDSMQVNVQVDPTTSAAVQQPYERVAYKLIKGVVSYQTGSLWQQNHQASINGTVVAEINNQSIQVTPTAGSEVTVANTVNANITQSVTQQANVINDFVASTPGPNGVAYTATIVSLQPNARDEFVVTVPEGFYDSFALSVYSKNGYLANYNFYAGQIRWQNWPVFFPNIPTNPASWDTLFAQTPLTYLGGNDSIYTARLYATENWGQAYQLNQIVIDVLNTASTTISDTLYLVVYPKYAGQQVINTVQNPALLQEAVGSFDQIYTFGTATSGSTIFPASVGGYIKVIHFTVQGTSSGSPNIEINNGGSQLMLYQFNVNQNIFDELHFGQGIANNGLVVYGGSFLNFNGYVIYSSQTASPIPKTIT